MSSSGWEAALAQLGRRLFDAGASPRDVILPTAAEAFPRMGALVVQLDDQGARLEAFDAGRTRTLGQFSDPTALVDEVVRRTIDPQPEPMDWPESRVPEANAVMLDVAAQVAEAVASNPQSRLAFSLPIGGIVDKFGTSNGFLLYPGGTPFAQRSLPPSELDPAFPDLGLLRYGIAQPDVAVHAELIPPGFGQPGGGVLLSLAEPASTIRDLLVTGALRRLRLI